MTSNILATKLHRPSLSPQRVQRPRLVYRLNEGLAAGRQVTLISAPAGFGKTTCVSEWLHNVDLPVAWLSLDSQDNDPGRFFLYLVAALQRIEKNLGVDVDAVLQSGQIPSIELLTTTLLNDILKLDYQIILVLDDFHILRENAIQKSFELLVANQPENLHLVLITREDPLLPLARLRANNQLTEIRAADLRFTPDEAGCFLNELMHLSLSKSDIHALSTRTEGWVAGLQLAALSLQGRSDTDQFIKVFTGSHVYIVQYLVEEVLSRQTQEIQDFLLKTSILERFCVELCDEIKDEGGRMKDERGLNSFILHPSAFILDFLLRSNLFIIPLDDEGHWYRYHRLFADLLQSRLRQKYPPDVVAGIHRQAAAWFEQEGMIPEAIEHATAASDYTHIIRLVETNGLPMILQAHVRTVDRWLEAIPNKYYEKSPKLNLISSWLHILRGTPEQATQFIERLEVMFSSLENDRQDASLQAEWLALQSKLLNMQGKPAESRDLAIQALKLLPATNASVRSMVLVNLATAYSQMLDYVHAAETFQQLARDAQSAGDFTSEIIGRSGQAQMVLQQGRLHLGFEIASEGIKRIEITGKFTPFSATFYGELGQIYYYWHQLDLARKYLLLSIQTSGHSGYIDPEIYYEVMLSRIYQMEGNWDAAFEEIHKAEALTQVMPLAMIREEYISQRVRVLLATRQLTEAKSVIEAEGFIFTEPYHFPDLKAEMVIAHPLGLLYNSALRVLLYEARMGQEPVNLRLGIELASLVLEGELRCQQVPIALETILLRSQLHHTQGDEKKHIADVRKALELAEPEGYISNFVEEGQLIAEAISILVKQNLLEKVQCSYAQEILSAFPSSVLTKAAGGPHAISTTLNHEVFQESEGYQTLIEPLTPRELEVLSLIAAGDSNQAIAEKLVITVSAVKKHTSNIFGKLSVDSRTQAVARARQVGLLS